MREASFFSIMLYFLLFSYLGATDWAKDDFEVTGCNDKDYFKVVGVNNPEFTHTHPLSGMPCTEDLYNIQTAVDNYMYVKLKDTFHLGELTFDDNDDLEQDGIILIRNPNVVLKGPATLMYGGGWWQIVVAAPGVKIMNLTLLEGFDVGIHIRVGEMGDPIILAGNTIKTVLNIDSWDPVICGVVIRNNYLEAALEYSTWISGTYWVDEEPNMVPLIIKNNKIHSEGPPENFIEAVVLGGPGMAIQQAIVKRNTFTGKSAIGISLRPYTRNIMVSHNNLSGLATWEAQFHIMGEYHKITKNLFGRANDTPAEWFIPGPFEPVHNLAVLISNDNWGWGEPRWTRYNKLMKNDYRNCGLNDGWDIDEETDEIYSRGCILLDPVFPPGDEEGGLGLQDNLIAEHLFPHGTNVCNQVWDMGGLNKIVGWETYCGDSDNCLKKPILAQMSAGAKQIAGYKNALYERIAEKEKYLDQYLEKSKGKEMTALSVIPQKFDLLQNYPNPFNPTTRINYELPITNYVNLSIYNTLGQKVATLVSEKQAAGSYEVQWDASGFSSGVYYYRIETGEFQDVKKMILLR